MLCFPPAGGGASGYHAWLDHLPDDVDLYLVQPPGREDRYDEPPWWDADTALDEVAHALAERDTRVHVVFGHSMGALLALNFTARYPDAVGAPLLVLSSAAPPGNQPDGAGSGRTSGAELALAYAAISQTPAAARALAELPAELRAALERRWLADLRVQRSLAPPVHPPREAVAVWAGTTDLIGADVLPDWARFVPVREIRLWPGDHDYPFSASARPVAAELVRLARRARRTRG